MAHQSPQLTPRSKAFTSDIDSLAQQPRKGRLLFYSQLILPYCMPGLPQGSVSMQPSTLHCSSLLYNQDWCRLSLRQSANRDNGGWHSTSDIILTGSAF